MEIFKIKLWNKNNDTVQTLTLLIQPDQDGFVQLEMPNGKTKKAASGDLFSSLAHIRSDLEKDNQFILCNASKRNVAPSRMSRQMGNGRKAYKLCKGKQALLDDLVDIFSPIDSDEVSTVGEQKLFYQQWINSLG